MAIAMQSYSKEPATALAMMKAALGWLFFATSDPEYAYLGREIRVACRGEPAIMVDHYGGLLVEFVEHQTQEALLAAIADEETANGKLPASETANTPSVSTPTGYPGAAVVSSVVIFSQVGNANTGEGKKVAKELEGLTGKALPLVPMPDLKAARAALRAEFPYAADVIDDVLRDVALRSACPDPPDHPCRLSWMRQVPLRDPPPEGSQSASRPDSMRRGFGWRLRWHSPSMVDRRTVPPGCPHHPLQGRRTGCDPGRDREGRDLSPQRSGP